ncbi:hypothetical protein, partial [Burkholderia sp. HI2714]|uniref:hypothetical protein n=1 Tax=Burkholderia sp. HI2714 TaxID=2015359 RepID=UPI001C529A24
MNVKAADIAIDHKPVNPNVYLSQIQGGALCNLECSHADAAACCGSQEFANLPTRFVHDEFILASTCVPVQGKRLACAEGGGAIAAPCHGDWSCVVVVEFEQRAINRTGQRVIHHLSEIRGIP